MTSSNSAHSRCADARERSLWTLHRLAPGKGVCNTGLAVRVGARVRLSPLRAALHAIVAHHPELRETFCDNADEVRVRLLPATVGAVLDSRALREEDLAGAVEELLSRPFDLHGLLVRCGLLWVPRGSVLCLVLHRLVADDAAPMLRELAAFYDSIVGRVWMPSAARETRPAQRRPAPRAESLRYWRVELADVDPQRLPMATAQPVPTRPSFAGQHLHRRLGADAIAALAALRSRAHASDTAVLLTTAIVLLAQHGCGPDVVVGVPVPAGTGTPNAHTLSGRHNTLPIRVTVNPGDRFDDVLCRTHDALRRGTEHGDVSVEDLLPTEVPHGAEWRTPLLRHAVHVSGSDAPCSSLRLAGRPVKILDVLPTATRLDLELLIRVEATGINLSAQFSTEVHSSADVSAFLERFSKLLLHADGSTLVDQQQLSAADRALIEAVNATQRQVTDASVAELIVRQAHRTPDARAVDDMTYRQLLGLAGAVRERLQDAGVCTEDVVAVAGPRGGALAAAMLGVWTAGAAYLPLGTGLSSTRVRQQLEDAEVSIVLRVGSHDVSATTGQQVIDVDAGTSVDAAIPDYWSSGTSAYVLFTSGSTGRAKGVLIGHRALTNFVCDMAVRLALSPGERVLWSTNISFDISALEVFTALVTGAQVRTAPDHILLSPEAFLELIEQWDLDVIQGTPTLWQHIAPVLARELAGRRVLVGGEYLSYKLACRLVAAGGVVRNMYGPTETTIWSTSTVLSPPLPDPVPIGLPISNTQVYVLDPQGRPVFPGLPGELCIAGAGVAVGYLKDAARTETHFVTDPVLGRYYRTGDRVRQRPDGALEFIGRVDRQVKVRGYRIELAEVEAVLSSYDTVTAAAVVTETDPAGRLRLAAAVHTADTSASLVHDLQWFAAIYLPHAAIPARIVGLPTMPMTPNGKIDYGAVRQVLAMSGRRGAGDVDHLPSDPLLLSLVDLWRAELGSSELSMHANFFQHGGHTEQALAFAARIGQHLDRILPFDAVFSAPTPEAMRRLVDGEAR